MALEERIEINESEQPELLPWLNSPDPANDKMGKILHLKPKPDQPA